MVEFDQGHDTASNLSLTPLKPFSKVRGLSNSLLEKKTTQTTFEVELNN